MGKATPNRSPKGRANKLKRQLQESNERYALVVKATNDVIYDLDLVTGSVIWNDALRTQYGYKRSDLVSTLEWWVGHVHSEDAARIEDEISVILLGNGTTWQLKYRFLKADGEYAVVRDRAYVQRSRDGVALRIIGSMLDVTEMERLDKAKDEFTSLVSHQLRTPLTVIQLYTAMLSDGLVGSLDPQQLKHIDQINRASVRLTKVVSNILHISRLELDRVSPNLEPTDMAALITAAIESLQPLAAERGVAISFQVQADMPKPQLDQTLFAEVLQNLLTNAIHYSPFKKGEVLVALSGDDAGILLCVKDNGIGIPAKAQSKIFSRFYRADNAVQAGVEGTGLGLYLARLIVESAGGTITFKSTAGKGTTFFIRLPASTLSS